MSNNEIKVVKKEKYNLGMNTHFSNGYILSSIRMMEGYTSYNVYGSGGWSNLIIEDSDEGFHTLKKQIIKGEI